jgi:curved DNA-binding protein CbpA
MGNNGSRQYTYHQYYEVIKNDPNFNFKKINFELLDPHEVLEVRKNYTWDELKDAYKYTALLTHPDKKGGNEIVFNFVTECFKKLAYDFKAKQQDKTFLDLKKQVEEYYSKEKEEEKKQPPIDENFHDRFNRTFNMCRMDNEELDFGYGDTMEKSSKVREDYKQEKLLDSKKFDNNSFNKIFEKHTEKPLNEIIKYRDPEPMVLAKKMNYSEIGGKRPDDYSSPVERDGRNLIYTDYKKAYSTTRLISEAEIKTKKDFNNVEEYQKYREKKLKKGLSEKELNYMENKKIREEEEERARLERIENENRRIKINNEKASRLLLK